MVHAAFGCRLLSTGPLAGHEGFRRSRHVVAWLRRACTCARRGLSARTVIHRARHQLRRCPCGTTGCQSREPHVINAGASKSVGRRCGAASRMSPGGRWSRLLRCFLDLERRAARGRVANRHPPGGMPGIHRTGGSPQTDAWSIPFAQQTAPQHRARTRPPAGAVKSQGVHRQCERKLVRDCSSGLARRRTVVAEAADARRNRHTD